MHDYTIVDRSKSTPVERIISRNSHNPPENTPEGTEVIVVPSEMLSTYKEGQRLGFDNDLNKHIWVDPPELTDEEKAQTALGQAESILPSSLESLIKVLLDHNIIDPSWLSEEFQTALSTKASARDVISKVIVGNPT